MSTVEEWRDAVRELVTAYDESEFIDEPYEALEAAIALLSAAICEDCAEPLYLSVLSGEWHPRFRPITNVALPGDEETTPALTTWNGAVINAPVRP